MLGMTLQYRHSGTWLQSPRQRRDKSQASNSGWIRGQVQFAELWAAARTRRLSAERTGWGSRGAGPGKGQNERALTRQRRVFTAITTSPVKSVLLVWVFNYYINDACRLRHFNQDILTRKNGKDTRSTRRLRGRKALGHWGGSCLVCTCLERPGEHRELVLYLLFL
jgi:hypothetical protein